jgi:hypothetical protein
MALREQLPSPFVTIVTLSAAPRIQQSANAIQGGRLQEAHDLALLGVTGFVAVDRGGDVVVTGVGGRQDVIEFRARAGLCR